MRELNFFIVILQVLLYGTACATEVTERGAPAPVAAAIVDCLSSNDDTIDTQRCLAELRRRDPSERTIVATQNLERKMRDNDLDLARPTVLWTPALSLEEFRGPMTGGLKLFEVSVNSKGYVTHVEAHSTTNHEQLDAYLRGKAFETVIVPPKTGEVFDSAKVMVTFHIDVR